MPSFSETFLILGDDLETVAQTNVPPGRLAFRREVLNEEKQLMMLSRRLSRATTGDLWVSDEISSTSSRNVPNGMVKGLVSTVLGMCQEKEELKDVEDRRDERVNGK